MISVIPVVLAGLACGDSDADLPRSLSPAETRAEASKWEFDVAPYGWLTSVSGTAQVGALSATSSASFSDVFKNLEFVAALHAEAWHNEKIGILLDTNWVKTEVDATTPIGGTASLTSWLGVNEAALALRSKVDVLTFDFLFGVRWVYLSNEIETTLGPSAEKHHNFLDPMFGARISGEPWEWLELSLRIDAGGFGVGTDLSGSIAAGAGFHVSRVVTLMAAYKAMGLKVEQSGWNVDLRFHGPLIGIDFRF